MAVVSSFQIAIVLQDLDHIGDAPGSVIDMERGIGPFETVPRSWREDSLSGCLGKNLHRDRVGASVSQAFLEPRDVVDEVVLPRRSEQPSTVYLCDILRPHAAPALPCGEILETREEGLYVVGAANAKSLVHGTCNA